MQLEIGEPAIAGQLAASQSKVEQGTELPS
jgi:hypothetical protein